MALNTTLTSADLEGNSIGDDGACELAVGLGRNAALKTLNVAENDIGPVGAGALAAALGLNNSLTTLDLGIKDDGCRHLAAALERNSKLEMVLLHSNNG